MCAFPYADNNELVHNVARYMLLVKLSPSSRSSRSPSFSLYVTLRRPSSWRIRKEAAIVLFFALPVFYNLHVKRGRAKEEVQRMKGYLVGSGYMGLVGDIYMLFTSEEEYEEYLLDD